MSAGGDDGCRTQLVRCVNEERVACQSGTYIQSSKSLPTVWWASRTERTMGRWIAPFYMSLTTWRPVPYLSLFLYLMCSGFVLRCGRWKIGWEEWWQAEGYARMMAAGYTLWCVFSLVLYRDLFIGHIIINTRIILFFVIISRLLIVVNIVDIFTNVFSPRGQSIRNRRKFCPSNPDSVFALSLTIIITIVTGGGE